MEVNQHYGWVLNCTDEPGAGGMNHNYVSKSTFWFRVEMHNRSVCNQERFTIGQFKCNWFYYSWKFETNSKIMKSHLAKYNQTLDIIESQAPFSKKLGECLENQVNHILSITKVWQISSHQAQNNLSSQILWNVNWFRGIKWRDHQPPCPCWPPIR